MKIGNYWKILPLVLFIALSSKHAKSQLTNVTCRISLCGNCQTDNKTINFLDKTTPIKFNSKDIYSAFLPLRKIDSEENIIQFMIKNGWKFNKVNDIDINHTFLYFTKKIDKKYFTYRYPSAIPQPLETN